MRRMRIFLRAFRWWRTKQDLRGGPIPSGLGPPRYRQVFSEKNFSVNRLGRGRRGIIPDALEEISPDHHRNVSAKPISFKFHCLVYNESSRQIPRDQCKYDRAGKAEDPQGVVCLQAKGPLGKGGIIKFVHHFSLD